jgi:perosamine synthetase
MIPYGRQSIDDSDVEGVVEVLRGDWLTQGPAVAAFEDALASVVSARHAVAFSNGTAALHAACAAGGIGPGDVVSTSALTFVASANCARFVGADAVLVDIDPATLNLDLAGVPAESDAVVAVHYAGLPVRLEGLEHRPRVVIEDASHALGAATTDGPVGGCARSDMATFSFHPVKTVTTGEGGAVTTNSDELAARLRAFRSHGTVPHPEHGGWYYEAESLGYNYRMTDIQAALGISQLRRLERFVTRRNELADRYRDLLRNLPVELPPAAPVGSRHAYHLFPIRVANRRQVYDELRVRGVGVQVHYVPVYRHPIHAADATRFPATEDAYAGLLSLPMFPSLTDEQQLTVVEALEDSL